MDLFFVDLEKINLDSSNRTLHNMARRIVKYVAENIYNIENSELEIINNKPKFKFSDVNFSISHSRKIAAVCFDNNPIGFDIETILPRENYKQIAKRMKFDLTNDTLEDFYYCWTRYEAEYKLQLPIKSIYTTKLNDKYTISVASSETTDICKSLKIFDLTFKFLD